MLPLWDSDRPADEYVPDWWDEFEDERYYDDVEETEDEIWVY